MGTVVVRHRPNQGAINAVLRSQSGSLARDMMRRGILVQSEARRLITSMRAVDTGRLRSSIGVRQQMTGRGILTAVGSDVEYAAYVHDGTSGPYEITPLRARALRFTVDGDVVFAKRVVHPGIQGRPYLVQALPAMQG